MVALEKTEKNKTEQIRERDKLLDIFVRGCVSHLAFEGDGPTLEIYKIYSDVREVYSALGSLDKNDQDVGTAIVGAPACGDVMKLQIKVNNGKIGQLSVKLKKLYFKNFESS